MRKLASLLSVLMLLCTLASAQTRTISGIVKDEKGEAVPFATVQEAGTKNAVQADGNGTFSIKVATGARLTISAAGFTAQTIIPAASGAQMVTLSTKTGQMQEVIVSTFTGVKRQARSL